VTGVIVITGSGRGIGAATARMAAQRGYAVCVNAAGNLNEAQAVARAIADAGGRAIAVGCDVAREDQVSSMFAEVDRALGPVTALVNNAGITGPVRKVVDIDAASLERTLAVNVTGSFLCAREAVRRMSTARGGKGGAIVNMSSRAAQLGGSNEWVHYAASKGAIESFTVGLAREVAGEGIRVNAVMPGLIDTDIHLRSGIPDRVQRLLPGVPMGRIGTPDEVAEVILWLLSDAAGYITGVSVPISGGR
jgi:NAD(P)-dependent dehydrogenase (short-subunit alcohol dehydrogenase family)